ncbi:hypothetical protein OC845_004481 [Tilletia horrida]|nr:hypothetical protein OC845_004481 [Tilletia horrida]
MVEKDSRQDASGSPRTRDLFRPLHELSTEEHLEHIQDMVKDCLRQADLVLKQSTDSFPFSQACNHPCMPSLGRFSRIEQEYLYSNMHERGESRPLKTAVATLTSEPSYLQTLQKLVELVRKAVFLPILAHFDAVFESSPGPSPSAPQSPAVAPEERKEQDQTSLSHRPGERQREDGSADSEAYFALHIIFQSIQVLIPYGKAQPIAIQTNTARTLLEVCGPEIFETAFRLCYPPLNRNQPSGTVTVFQSYSAKLLASISTESALSILFKVGRVKPQMQSAPLSSSTVVLPEVADQQPRKMQSYVSKMAKRMSALHLLRPDGVSALMRFSADDDELAPNLAQLDSSRAVLILARVLSDEPAGVPRKVWIQSVLPQITQFIAEAASQPSPSPASSVQVRAVVLAMARFARKEPAWTKHILLQDYLYSAFLGQHAASSGAEDARQEASGPVPRQETVAKAEEDVVVRSLRVKQAADALLCIFEHAEPSTDFFHFLLRPILAPCLALLDHLSRQITSAGRSSKVSSKGKGRADADGGRQELRDAIRTCLSAWIRLAPAEEIAHEFGPIGGGALLERVATGRIFAIDRQRKESSSDMTTPVSESEITTETGDESVQPGDEDSDTLPVPSPELDGTSPSNQSLTWASDESGTSLRRKSQVDPLSAILDQLPASMKSQVHLTESLKASNSLPPSTLGALSLPDIQPLTLTTLLKECGRIDVAKLVLQAVLDRYVAARAQQSLRSDEPGVDVRPIIYIQFILQLFDTFGEALLKDDVQGIFAFVDFVLSQWSKQPEPSRPEDDKSAPEEKAHSEGLSGLLKISDSLPSRSQDEMSKEDGDEDSSGELTTALNLLLALLEGDPQLSTHTNPMLGVIQARLPPLFSSKDEEVRRVVQEAMLVLQARKASEHSANNRNAGKGDKTKKAQQTPRERGLEKYQEALKLLQDPILPVRAHGLVILRELVSEPEPSSDSGSTQRRNTKSARTSLISDLSEPSTERIQEVKGEEKAGQKEARPEADPALLPAILDIFVQAIQDEESYLYLNAVQGLAALAISGGKGVLKVLVGKYVKDDVGGGGGRGGLVPDQAEVDRRLRIGEALLRVVQRCGPRLGPDVSLVAEPLLTMLRKADEPVTLRTSAVSLLGTCIEAAPMAMQARGFTAALVPICLDIISLESTDRNLQSVSKLQRASQKAKRKETISVRLGSGALLDVDEEEEEQKADDALAKDTKLPQLRRSALFLLSLLLSGANQVLEMHLEEAEREVSGGGTSSLLTSIGGRKEGEGGGGGESDSSSLMTLRLPGGALLAPLPASANSGRAAGERRTTPPPLMFDPQQLERTKVVLRYVKEKDMDAVVRVQAGEAEQMCLDLEVRLVRVAAVSS